MIPIDNKCRLNSITFKHYFLLYIIWIFRRLNMNVGGRVKVVRGIRVGKIGTIRFEA